MPASPLASGGRGERRAGLAGLPPTQTYFVLKHPPLAPSPPYIAGVWIRRAIAIVLILVGVVWFFQGIGVIEGSFMTGEAVWAVLGVVCVVAGAALL